MTGCTHTGPLAADLHVKSILIRLSLKKLHLLLQVFIQHQDGVSGAELERELFILRKLMEKEKAERIGAATADTEGLQEAEKGADAADFYICSLSNTTITYKVSAPCAWEPAAMSACTWLQLLIHSSQWSCWLESVSLQHAYCTLQQI